MDSKGLSTIGEPKEHFYSAFNIALVPITHSAVLSLVSFRWKLLITPQVGGKY